MTTVLLLILIALVLVLIDRTKPRRRGGSYVLPDVELPPGFVPPSASLGPPKRDTTSSLPPKETR